VKTILLLALSGALIGVIAASYIVPPALSWYSSPGGLPRGAQIQAVVEIPEVIQYATSKLIRGQAIGGGIGALVGFVLGLVTTIRRRSGRRDPATAAAT
jgi:hypothetical protein